MSQTFQQIVALVAFGALLLPINVLTQRGRHWSGTPVAVAEFLPASCHDRVRRLAAVGLAHMSHRIALSTSDQNDSDS
jgi:hypothetical protein